MIIKASILMMMMFLNRLSPPDRSTPSAMPLIMYRLAAVVTYHRLIFENGTPFKRAI